MKIHEFQAKELFAKFGIPVPVSQVVESADAARAGYEALERNGELKTGVAVVKAQVHAGGRGKGGGVRLVKSAQECQEAAEAILSKPLVTHQTGPEGVTVNKLLVEAGSNIASELYAGIALDRSLGVPVLMASTEGGVEIEEVAVQTPEKILKEPLDPHAGLMPFQARSLAFRLGLPAKAIRPATDIFMKLSKLFLETDCSLAEINPLVVTGDDGVVALDGKMNFDSNGLYRQADVVKYRDLAEEDAREIEASKYNLSYISLDGSIGCMVNGAGLAMATMDIIKLHGGEPANFLDVGGGAKTEQVTAAFKIILEDSKVQGILVNIFGGIMRCDVIAQGILEAAREVEIKVPLVVRLEGTNVEKGKELIESSGLDIISASSMDDAARKIVEATRG